MGSSQAPFVAMRTDLRKDERARYLADAAGYSLEEACGRLFFLWSFCADRKLELAPDDCEGYAVSEAIVKRFLGPLGVDAILGGGCDDLAMGVVRPDGLVYLRGTSDTVSRLRQAYRTARAGGTARKEAHKGPDGRFVSENTDVQLAGGEQVDGAPPDVHLTSSSEPAASTPEPRTQNPEPRRNTDRAPSAPRRKAGRAMPDMWVPERSEANLVAEAKAKARGVDLHEQLIEMRDWAASKNATMVDWDASWRNWTRRAKPKVQSRQNALELQLERVAMLEQQERGAQGELL